MKRYDTYKDSGIEWIGEIPSHWGIKRIKHRCYVKARVGWKGLKSDEFLSKGYAYLVTGSDFKNDNVDWGECYHIDKERYDEDPYIQLQNEDLLITKDGTIGKLAIVRNLDKPACLNSGIFVVRSTKDDFSTEFLFWLLKSKTFTDFNGYTSYGSTIQHLYQNVFVEYAFPFPSLKEQTAIAHYLDRKTAELDALIADKKRLLELYEAEKKAIINQAVTKGLDPDVPMKDSGVEWLGEVPAEWEVPNMKYVCEFILDGTDGSFPRVSNGYRLLSVRNIVNDEFVFRDDDSRVSEEHFVEISKRFLIQPGDVQLAIVGATLGKVAIVKTLPEAFVTQRSVATLRVNNKCLPEFLFYFIKTSNFQSFLWLNTGFSAQPGIYLGTIQSSSIPLPQIKEQQSIVRHIETECARIDAKIAKTEKLIALLTEYRTALISEVVTGKVKVVD